MAPLRLRASMPRMHNRRPSATCHERPRCMHILGSDNVRVLNLTMRNAPFWNLHFQFSSNVLVDGVQVRRIRHLCSISAAGGRVPLL